MTRARLAIVAEHRMTADAVRRTLRHAPACEVVGYVDIRRSCALAIANARVDAIVVDDPGAPELTLERLRELRAAAPEAKLILLTSERDRTWLAAAAKAGADAAIGKLRPGTDIGVLVREVVAGNLFHAFPAAAPVPQAGSGDVAALTRRELEILLLVASGASNSRVAAALWVTEQTVKFHLSNVYQKLGVANRTEASRYAHVHGLLDASTEAATTDAEAA